MPHYRQETQYTERTKRKRSKGLGCLIFVLIFIAVIAGVIYFGFNYVTGEIEGEQSGAPIEFVVEQGTSPSVIAEMLKESGVIEQPDIFLQYIKFVGADTQLQYGTFELYENMGYDAIIEQLKEMRVVRETVMVTFPEGISALGFAFRMEEAGLCSVEEFLDTANNGDFSQYDFWNEIPEDPLIFMKSEGYLFPETYEFFTDSSVYDLVDKLYAQTDKEWTDERLARLEELGMTLHEFLTLTSIVQREAGPIEHQADVAAVLHNRLEEDSPHPRLECNVSGYVNRAGDNNYIYDTIAYYIGGGNSDAGWELFAEGEEYYDIYNAYNTYGKEGLPAGPICNPGRDAIDNTLYPTEGSEYYFFVTDLAGNYYYAETVREHDANVAYTHEVNASLDDE